MVRQERQRLRPELAPAHWRKTRLSGHIGDCVELGDLGQPVGVQDSKDPDGPVLVWSHQDWASYLSSGHS
jgi:hypothetical protein